MLLQIRFINATGKWALRRFVCKRYYTSVESVLLIYPTNCIDRRVEDTTVQHTAYLC